jgi:hypothetical protein
MDNHIGLISTDFDGTLFAEFENPPVPLRLQQLLAELQNRGTKWAINTGRDMSSLMETLGRANLSVHPDFLVLVEREIYVHEQSSYVPLTEWNTPCSCAHAEVFARVKPDLPRLVEWINSRFRAMLYEDAYSPLCLIAESNADADIIHQFLLDYCEKIPHLTVVRNDVYARFCHTAFNKGTALAELARRIGVSRDQVFAVGDHLNDLPMLNQEYAGMLAAPSNAVASVQAAIINQGGYLSELPGGRGVVDAIEHYLRQGKKEKADPV